jgi:hypothetical protein
MQRSSQGFKRQGKSFEANSECYFRSGVGLLGFIPFNSDTTRKTIGFFTKFVAGVNGIRNEISQIHPIYL